MIAGVLARKAAHLFAMMRRHTAALQDFCRTGNAACRTHIPHVPPPQLAQGDRTMSTMSVRAGVIAFVTVLATVANEQTALADLPEHALVAEFCCGIEEPSPGDFKEFGFGEAVAIRDDVAFIGAPHWRDKGKVDVLNLTATDRKSVV